MGKDWDRLTWDARGRQPGDPENKGQTASPHRGADAPTFIGGTRAQEWHQAWATEALRVLKPGGHLLAFGGTRTYHRLVCAVEDAGFEIRDTISWLYGSGFPKSLDVGKQIDRRGGANIGWFGPWLREERHRRSISSNELSGHFPSKTGRNTGCVRNWELGYNLPTLEQFNTLCRVLDLPFERIEEVEREKVGERRQRANSGDSLVPMNASVGDVEDITAPATPEAERWEGWGTALKPAHEPVVVARKPLSGTVAGNVLEHGTGALNVDGCRVDAGGDNLGGGAEKAENRAVFDHDGWARPWMQDEQALEDHASRVRENVQKAESLGRWPANVVLSHTEGCVQVGTRKVKGSPKPYTRNTEGVSTGYTGPLPWGDARKNYGRDGGEEVSAWSCTPDCPVRLLDEQTGEQIHGAGAARDASEGTHSGGQGVVGFTHGGPAMRYGDTGGASRFMPSFGFSTMDQWPQPGDASTEDASTSAGSREESSDDNSPTDGSGSKPTGPSQPDTTSTTETTTGSTTPSTTLSSSSGDGTSDSTEPSEPPRSSETASGSVLGASSGSPSTPSPSEPTHPASPTAETAGESTCASGEPETRSTTTPITVPIESGSELRFRYQSKASRSERNAGLEGFEERTTDHRWNKAGEWTDETTPAKNNHPTVKPISLMRWLVRLVTPPGGTVLDPFAGSGTTGCACALEGFDFIGLEREPEYVAIAEARIRWWHKHRGDGEAAQILAAGEARDEVEATGQLGMFD